MLTIDRVHTEMEVLPGPAGQTAPSQRAGTGIAGLGAAGFDPAARERLRAAVLEILRDHFHEIARRGGL